MNPKINKLIRRIFALIRKSFCLLIAALPLLLAWADTARAGNDCQTAEAALDTAGKLRGLSPKRRVPCRLQNKTEVERYLRETIKKKMSETRVEHEGQTYRMLGFIPKDFDYFDKVINLYTDQLGGYYDPEKKYYAMADWMPAIIQMPIAVHELTHALQDQHFSLAEMIDQEKLSSDVVLARAALIEGDATSVMLDYSRMLAGQPSIAKEQSVSMFMLQNISGAMLSQSLREAPPALQASLLFPYVSGLNFCHALLRKGGYRAIDRAFSRPPESTEEILHPQIYLRGKRDFTVPADPQMPEELGLKEQKPVFRDTLGEFFVSTLLATWVSPQQASEAASGWGGDRVVLYPREGERKWALAWQLLWDSKDDASEFFDVLLKAYTVRFAKVKEQEKNAARFTDSDFGDIKLSLNGKEVLVLIY